MSTKNTNIRDLFAITQGMDKVSHESFISQEYNAFDWPRFFFGFINSAWRGLTNKSVTKIDNIAVLIEIFTGKLTTFGQYFQAVPRILTGINLGSIAVLWSAATGEFGHGKMGQVGNSIAKAKATNDGINPYYFFIFSPNKVDFNNFDKYKDAATKFKQSIDIIKKEVCFPIEAREMRIGEKNALKLWRPELVKEDIDKCLRIVESKTISLDDATKKKWNQLYKDLIAVAQDVVKYIEANTFNDFK